MFTLKAPAKINWFLSVIRKREDGYHEISSLMQCVSLYDYLTFEESGDIQVINGADIPLKENLVYRAAVFLRGKSSVNKGAAITLKKEIPMAAGLGGGSSDAACTLLGLRRLWGLDINDKELMELGGMLGSDIPFFFNGPFAEVGGRGEEVRRLKANARHILLLAKPEIGVASKWAYAEVGKFVSDPAHREELTKKYNNIKLLCQALDKQDFASVAVMLRNDLEVPVIRKFKVVGELKSRLIELGANASLMSGSGAAVFGLFDDGKKAEKAAGELRLSAPGIWCRVVETIVN